MQPEHIDDMSDEDFFKFLEDLRVAKNPTPCDFSCQGFCEEHSAFWDNKAEEDYQKEMLEKLENLLTFIESCRPSTYSPWRDCEKEEMLKLLI